MSRYSEKLFKINVKKQTLEINKIEVREVKEYREILERDKGGKIKGDADGRKKYLAKRELMYVYIMADPFNLYSVLNDERKHKLALQETGLIEVEGWKIDSKIKEAMIRYVEDLKLSPTAFAFINSRKALNNIGEDIQLLNDYSEELRIKIKQAKDIVDDKSSLEEDVQKAKNDIQEYFNSLSYNNKEILNLTSTLPDRINSLDKLKVKLAEEDNERDEVIGGGSVFRREG